MFVYSIPFIFYIRARVLSEIFLFIRAKNFIDLFFAVKRKHDDIAFHFWRLSNVALNGSKFFNSFARSK